LLEGWRGAAQAQAQTQEATLPAMAPAAKQSSGSQVYASAPLYGGYLDDSAGAHLRNAYSF
jgi:hypothetical protein